MQFDFSSAGQLALTISIYVKKMIDDFAQYNKTKTTAKTPATDHLFWVDNNATHLLSEGISVFHDMVAKALFLAKHAKPDIATTVRFLITRVSKLDEDD